jgi:all-trans-retinol 13,14-reductase
VKQIGHSYKQHPVADSYDAIVIGSGMGGLTTAALLAKHGGQRVLVLERHYTPGGFTHVFRRPGYEWDAGVHYIGQVNDPRSPMRAVFDHITEGRLDWNPMPDVYDRISIGDRNYEFPTGLERFRARIGDSFPAERKAIDQYVAAVLATVRASNLYFAEKAIPGPIARLIGPMLRSGFLRRASLTTAQVLSQITRNPELIGVLTGQWGDYGLPPGQSSFGIHAIIAHHYFEGAGYPVGGASEIAASIAPVIERAGGEIISSAEVSAILLDQGGRAIGVRMADGRELRARTIISNAGAQNTFGRLLPPDLAASAGILEELKSIPPSIGHVCLYAGVKRAAGEADFQATNRWIYGGPDHDASFARFAADPSAPWPCLFISFPSSKDPTFEQRYPGRSTIELVAPVPYESFARWAETKWKHRGTEYDQFKRELADRLQSDLERHVPEVRGRIDYAEVSTPLSTRHFANYQHGEIYGLSATPARFRVRSLGVRTPVRNLYLTGTDACTLGVGGAMMGGVLTASVVLRRNLMRKVSRPGTTRPVRVRLFIARGTGSKSRFVPPLHIARATQPVPADARAPSRD